MKSAWAAFRSVIQMSLVLVSEVHNVAFESWVFIHDHLSDLLGPFHTSEGIVSDLARPNSSKNKITDHWLVCNKEFLAILLQNLSASHNNFHPGFHEILLVSVGSLVAEN